MPTVSDLKIVARNLNIKGRSKMNKKQLLDAIASRSHRAWLALWSKPQRKSGKSVKRKSKKKSRKPVKKSIKPVKKSRKAKVKRKTVAQLRADCKKQGLVYDPQTKKCRQSKRRMAKKSRKPVKKSAKKSRKPRAKKSRKISSSSGMCTRGNKILADYKKWSDELSKDLSNRSKTRLLTVKYNKPSSNKPVIDPSTKKSVMVKNIPDDSLSASSWTPYIDDGKLDEDYKNDKFYKLSTCQKTCPNHGVLAQTDLNNLLGMASARAATCPFCNEAFKLKSEKKRPPYGTMTVSKMGEFFEMEFKMKSGTSDGQSYGPRNQWAYLPISEEGKLGLWLMIEGFKKGKLFTIGRSVTTGRFGIVFGGMHMKTNTGGGLSNHGYGRNPVKDMKDVVLQSMINEGNAVGVFTPSQLADFACEEEKHKNKFRMRKKTLKVGSAEFIGPDETAYNEIVHKYLNERKSFTSDEDPVRARLSNSGHRIKLFVPPVEDLKAHPLKFQRFISQLQVECANSLEDMAILSDLMKSQHKYMNKFRMRGNCSGCECNLEAKQRNIDKTYRAFQKATNKRKKDELAMKYSSLVIDFQKWQGEKCDDACRCKKSGKYCCDPYKCVTLQNKKHCLHKDQINQPGWYKGPVSH